MNSKTRLLCLVQALDIHPFKWSLSLWWILGGLSTLWEAWFENLSKFATRSNCSKLNARALRSRVPKGVVDALCMLTCFASHKVVSKMNDTRIHLMLMEHAIGGTLWVICVLQHTRPPKSTVQPCPFACACPDRASEMDSPWVMKSVLTSHRSWSCLLQSLCLFLLAVTTELRCHYLLSCRSPDVEEAQQEHHINLRLIRLPSREVINIQ